MKKNLAERWCTKRKNGGIEFALVHDVFGYWTLSKGRIEKNENASDGAKREIAEEIGLDVEVGKELGKNEYVASDPEKGKIKKRHLFSRFDQKRRYKAESNGRFGRRQVVQNERIARAENVRRHKRHFGGSAQRIEQKMNFSKFEEKIGIKFKDKKSAQAGFHAQVLFERESVFSFGAK